VPTVAELAIEVDGEDKGAEALLLRLDALVDSLDGKDATVNVHGDAASVEAMLTRIEEEVNALDNNDATVDVKANVKDFVAGIDQVEARAQWAEGTDITIDINAKIAQAMADFAVVEEMVNALDGRTAEVNGKADIAKFLADLAIAEAAVAELDGKTANVNVDLDTAGLMAQIAAARLAMAGLGNDINDDNKNGVTGWHRLEGAAQRASSQIRVLAMLAMSLGPALIPVAAVATAGIGMLGLALAGAGLSMGLFAGAAISALGPVATAIKDMDTAQKAFNKAVTDKQKEAALLKMKAIYESMDGPQQKIYDGVTALRSAWAALVDTVRPEIFAMATEALSALTALMPRLEPMLRGVTTSMHSMQTASLAAFGSPVWQTFFNYISDFGGPALEKFGQIFGNVITGIIGILNAFAPTSMGFMVGLENMTRAFADWGIGLSNNKGFQQFMDYVTANVPIVLGFISSLWHALTGLLVALAPYGSQVVVWLTAALDALTRLTNEHPKIVAVAAAIIGLGAIITNLLGPTMNLIKMITGLVTWIGSLSTITHIAGIAISGSLVAAIVAGIAAFALLVTGLVLAYQNFDNFRGAVDALVQKLKEIGTAIINGVKPAIDAVVGFFQDEVAKATAWVEQNRAVLTAGWNQIVAVVGGMMTTLVNAIIWGLDLIITAWNTAWPSLSVVLESAWTAIKGVISGALEMIRGWILAFAGLLTGDWQAVWDGLQTVTSGAWTMIEGVIQGALNIISGIFTLAMDEIKQYWTDWWNSLPPIVQTALGAVKSAFDTSVAAIQTGWTTFWNALSPIVSTAWSAVQLAVDTGWSFVQARWDQAVPILQAGWNAFWNGLEPIITTAWSWVQLAVDTGWSQIQSRWDQAVPILQSAWNVFWNGLEPIVTTAWGLIKTAAQTGWDALILSFETNQGIVKGSWDLWWAAMEPPAKAFNQVMAVTSQGLWDIIVTIWNAGTATVSTIWGVFWALLSTVASQYMAVINTVVNSGFAFIKTAFDAFIAAQTAVWNAFWSSLPAPVQTGMNTIKTVITTGLGLIVGIWQAQWSIVIQAVVAAWAVITSTIRVADTVIRTIFSGLMSFLNTTWADGWSRLGSTVSQWITTILGYVNGMVRDILGDITGLGGKLAALGRAAIQNLAQGIRDSIPSVLSAMGAVASAMAGGIGLSPATYGPLSGTGYILYRGQRFIQNLAEGLGYTDPLRLAMSNAASILSQGFSPGILAGTTGAVGFAASLNSGGGSSLTIQVAPGAVAVSATGGADPAALRSQFDNAAAQLAEQIRVAIEKR
jgi:phage-related protein